MQTDQPKSEIHLFSNRPLHLNKALGLGIVCTSGTIWITIPGQPEDIFLSAGERYALDSDGLALVEAVGKGSVQLLQAPSRLACFFEYRHRLTTLQRLILGDRL